MTQGDLVENEMWTFLLDIDGTLLKTQGAGLKAIRELMSQRYGVHQLPDVQLHGCTDHGIWNEIFRKLEIPIPHSLGDLIADYCLRLDDKIQESPGELLPGVLELMQKLSNRPDVAVGLLTGNAKRAAEIKLRKFELQSLFDPFGGFGDQFSDRNDVAKAAADSAHSFMGAKFSRRRCIVIGDTSNDIRCARSIGAKVIAVCTGGQEKDVLLSASPDLVLDDLTGHDQVLALIDGGDWACGGN